MTAVEPGTPVLAIEPTAVGSTAPAEPKGFRPDIQGIRAVAVLTVIFYHAGVPWLGGGFVGVDVFFVISGFLITGGIVEEVRRSGRLSLSGFYVRRMARILPAATVAILATLALARLLLPVTRWHQIGKDAAASSLYVVNWSFARNSVDYAALDQAPSPFQHFWSLAVEEQFYIVWPVMLLAVGWLTGRHRHRLPRNLRLQRNLLGAFAVIAVPSFVWSVVYTASNPSQAYFVTTTRMWELAVGAGLAIVGAKAASGSRIPAAVVGWAGLGAVLLAAVSYSDATPFPSYRALLPILGTAALVWGSSAAGAAGPARLLSIRPMVGIGTISYSLYLWHWPLLVIADGVEGPLSSLQRTGIVIGAMIPAWLSTRFIEKPAQRTIRNFRGRAGHRLPKLALGTALTAVGVLGALLLVQAVPSSRPPAISGPIGAEVLARGGKVTVVDSFPTLTPAVTGAATDSPAANRNGCMLDHPTTEPKACSYGALNSSKVIALVGDSHAAMYIPGLRIVAQRAGYRLDAYTKGSCPPADVPIDFQGRDYPECREWTRNVLDALVKSKPALVITAMSHGYKVYGGGLSFEDSRQPIADRLGAGWQKLLDAGVRVAGIRDIPKPGMVVPDCVAANLHHLSACARPQDEILWDEDQTTLAAKAHPGVVVLDFTSSLCGDGTCPAVIDRVIVYRDTNHLTATFARTMHEQMARQILPLLG